MELSRSSAAISQLRKPNKEIFGRIELAFIWISGKNRDAFYASSNRRVWRFQTQNVANSESTVALARSRHRIFTNTSCILNIRITFKNSLDTRTYTRARILCKKNDGQTILIEKYQSIWTVDGVLTLRSAKMSFAGPRVRELCLPRDCLVNSSTSWKYEVTSLMLKEIRINITKRIECARTLCKSCGGLVISACLVLQPLHLDCCHARYK